MLFAWRGLLGNHTRVRSGRRALELVAWLSGRAGRKMFSQHVRVYAAGRSSRYIFLAMVLDRTSAKADGVRYLMMAHHN